MFIIIKMVLSNTARIDVDEELLTKVIVYRKYRQDINDLTTDEPAASDTYDDYEIKAQCTLQTKDSRYVTEGVLIEGDLVGLFRYKYENEYCSSKTGAKIEPALIPKSKDKIKFLGQWFVIKACTPATNEDSGVIGWDFTAGQSGETTWNVDG